MNPNPEVLIRFNTHHDVNNPHSKEWRVIINGEEKLCNEIDIQCSSKTSKNFIKGVGFKWHIQCLAQIIDFESDVFYSDQTHFNKITLR